MWLGCRGGDGGSNQIYFQSRKCRLLSLALKRSWKRCAFNWMDALTRSLGEPVQVCSPIWGIFVLIMCSSAKSRLRERCKNKRTLLDSTYVRWRKDMQPLFSGECLSLVARRRASVSTRLRRRVVTCKPLPRHSMVRVSTPCNVEVNACRQGPLSYFDRMVSFSKVLQHPLLDPHKSDFSK